MDLLQDKIAAVRLQAAHLAASITEHLMKDSKPNSTLSDEFIDDVSKYGGQTEKKIVIFMSP